MMNRASFLIAIDSTKANNSKKTVIIFSSQWSQAVINASFVIKKVCIWTIAIQTSRDWAGKNYYPIILIISSISFFTSSPITSNAWKEIFFVWKTAFIFCWRTWTRRIKKWLPGLLYTEPKLGIPHQINSLIPIASIWLRNMNWWSTTSLADWNHYFAIKLWIPFSLSPHIKL